MVYGFAKGEKANMPRKELKALKKLGAIFLGFDAEASAKASAAQGMTVSSKRARPLLLAKSQAAHWGVAG